MSRRNRPVAPRSEFSESWSPLGKQLLFLASLIALVSIGVADYQTDWSTSLTILYMVPVAFAVWLVGLWSGVVICLLAATIRIFINLTSPLSAATDVWNAGMQAGEMLAMAVMLHHLRESRRELPWRRVFAVGGLLACALGLAVLGVRVFEQAHPTSFASTLQFAPAGDQHDACGELTQVGLEELRRLYENSIRSSRPVLLGSRTPSADALSPLAQPGELTDRLPVTQLDYDGGAGNNLELLIMIERQKCLTPLEEYSFHQQRLRRYLQNQAALNSQPMGASLEFYSCAQAFAENLRDAEEWPATLGPLADLPAEDWIGYCLGELNQAVAAKSLENAQRWSSELASAAFSLYDLHQWLDFLCRNYLSALDFQRQGEAVFVAANSQFANYSALTDLAYFPAGILTLHSDANFLALERMAERLFAAPSAQDLEIVWNSNPRQTATTWMPPHCRDAVAQVEELLSPQNRQVLAQAVRTPFEHSYFVSMLNRARQSQSLDGLLNAVRKFNSVYPRGSVEQLMDVLMDRGVSYGGLEGGDRYHPAVVELAKKLPGSDQEAFCEAARLTAEFNQQCEYATIMTLRQSFERKQLDCVRATDLISSIYRDSGHASLGHVRWSLGTFGHSVAAYLDGAADSSGILLADGLNSNGKLERWPQAYFRAPTWPPGMEQNRAPDTVELYVRGLDNYVWAEGYVIRGPNAGTLVSADVPYLNGRSQSVTRQIFAGPFPD